MGLFRLLILFLLGYMGYNFLKGFFSQSSDKSSSKVQGKSKGKSLDLRDADIQDAKFKDIDEDKAD